MRYREVASPVAGTEGAEAQESPSSPLPAAVLLLLFLRGFAASREKYWTYTFAGVHSYRGAPAHFFENRILVITLPGRFLF